MASRITYNSINIDLDAVGKSLTKIPRQERRQNESASGKIETINIFGRFDYEFEAVFTQQKYFDLMAWWSWARQGKEFSFALDSADVGYTKLDAAAASGQKVVPVTTTSDFTAGDFCLLRADDLDDEFEIIEIDTISAGVSVTAVDDLKYSYTASLGSELVTNGGFPADTTGWTAENAATLDSVAGGKAGNCLRITCDGAQNPYAWQTITDIEPGASYYFQCYIKAGTEATYWVLIFDVTNGQYIFTGVADEETAGDWSTSVEKEFVAPYGCVSVRIYLYQVASASAGTTLFYDSVTLKKINADTLTHKDYFAKVLTTEMDFRPALTGVIDKTSYYYKHTFRFTENL